MNSSPIVIVGAGPVGLVTALGLHHYGIPVVVLEEDKQLSLDTKAGTVLTRTLEVLDRYGASEAVLRESLRIDEIGEVSRATNTPKPGVKTDLLDSETRFPFVINIPQNSLEAVLETELQSKNPDILRLNSRVTDFVQNDDGVTVTVQGPDGEYEIETPYLLACDGGRSSIRTALGVEVKGKTLEQRYMLVDLTVDLDIDNPRDYPYLAYFSDPEEWMILVRQPHCWRFLFPLEPDKPEPTAEELKSKALHFIGEVDNVELLGTNTYSVHHRVASRWVDGRVFLLGDAAHLITPMWALGLNSGVLDASNLPWRLAWVLRGWADETILAGYESEQSDVAIKGSGQMAEAARKLMGSEGGDQGEYQSSEWGVAMTRTLLGVSLDVDGTGEWSIVEERDGLSPIRVGNRCPDVELFGPNGGRESTQQIASDSFVAMHFVDARRRPSIPDAKLPGLRNIVVSRWDAPHDSGFRNRGYFDPGDRLRKRLGVVEDSVVIVRPDSHIAAVLPWTSGSDVANETYQRIVRKESS